MKLKTFATQITKLTFAASVVFSAATAQAGVFKITPGTPGGLLSDPAVFEAFLQALEDQVNADLPAVETGEYTKGMANATAMAATGIGSAYVPMFTMGLIGVNAGLGIDLGEGNSLSDLDPQRAAGFGAHVGAIIGFNPSVLSSSPWGPIDPKRLRLYASFMTADQKVDEAEVNFSSFAVMGQYRLIEEKNLSSSLVKWNGVDISSGFRYLKMKGSFTQVFDVEFVESGVTATVSGPALLGADVNVFSIPVEASTSLRLLYVLNLIGGVGTDFNFGSSESIANYDSDIDLGGNGDATGELDLGSKASPTVINARVFAGMGLEFAVGTLNLILGKSLTASAWSVNTGLNFFW